MVIADVGAPTDRSPIRTLVDSSGPLAHDRVGKMLVRELEAGQPDFTVTFTEDKNGFYINGKKFSMQDEPLVRVRVGGGIVTIQHAMIGTSSASIRFITSRTISLESVVGLARSHPEPRKLT
jgi:hypothetical protein